MSVEHLHVCLAGFVDGSFIVWTVLDTAAGYCGSCLHGTTTNWTYLSAAIQAAADGSAVHLYVGIVHIAVYYIATAKQVTCQFNAVRFLVVQLLFVRIDRCNF